MRLPLASAIAPRVRRRLTGPLVLSLGATLCVQGLGVLTGILLARTLGPSSRGELAAVLLWPQLIIAVGSLGVNEGLTYEAARDRGTEKLRALTVTAFHMGWVQGAALAVIGFPIVALALGHYGSTAVWACVIYVATIPFALVALYLMYILNGIHAFGWFSIFRVLVIAVGAVGLVVLAAAGHLTVTNAVLATVAGNIITAIWVSIVVFRRTRGPSRYDAGMARGVLSFGLKSQLSTVSNLLNDRLDQVIISLFLASAQLGLYVVAWTLTSLTGLIGATIALVALPVVAREADVGIRIRVVRRYLRITLVSAMVIGGTLILVAPAFIRFAFGRSFESASGPARVLLAGSILLAVARVFGAVLKGLNRPVDAGFAEGFGLLVTGVGLAVLLPTMGIMGAAITSVLAYAATVAFATRQISHGLGVPTRELLLAPRAKHVPPWCQTPD